MNRIVLIILAAVFAGVACVSYDVAASKEKVVGKVTAFTRPTEGLYTVVEFKQTETGKFIGPDGKAFPCMPPDGVINGRYGAQK